MQAFAAERSWEAFHQPRNLALALVGEVGEVAECFQWRPDGAAGVGLPGWSDADVAHLGEELSDVLWYLVRLADRCGVDLAAAAEAKMAKNRLKYPAHLARGSSAKYTAYEGTKLVAAEAGAGAAAGAGAGARAGAGAGAALAAAAARSGAVATPPRASPRAMSPTDPRGRGGGGSGGGIGSGGGGGAWAAAAAAFLAGAGAAAAVAAALAWRARAARG